MLSRRCSNPRVSATLVAEMNGIITIPLEPPNDFQIYAHVCEKSHGPLRGVHLLLSQPGSVFDCLLNVFTLQIRIPFQDFIEAGVVCDLPDDDGNWNSHSADAGSSAHDVRVECNSIKHAHLPYKYTIVAGLDLHGLMILELLSAGMSKEQILADYQDLEPDDILAVLAFAARLSQIKRVQAVLR